MSIYFIHFVFIKYIKILMMYLFAIRELTTAVTTWLGVGRDCDWGNILRCLRGGKSDCSHIGGRDSGKVHGWVETSRDGDVEG